MRKPLPKHLPMSALIAGLLASPALGGAGVSGSPGAGQLAVQTFPAVMPAAVEEEIRKLARGKALDAYGMQGLTKRMAWEMRSRLADRGGVGLQRVMVPVQLENRPPQRLELPVAAVRMEKTTYLGIATSPVSPALGAQLSLEKGMGLVVDYVEKDSPADSAGFKVHDVLQKLDDQLLVNTEQFRVLVRAKKPGEVVKFSLMRAGQPVTLSVKLIEKEVAANEMPAMGVAPGASTVTSHSLTATRLDDKYQITITSDGKTKQVIVKDLMGGKIFEGGANTEEDLRAMPAEVAERVKGMLDKVK